MRTPIRPVLSLLAAVGLCISISNPAVAQSGSRSDPPGGSTGRASPPAGSSLRHRTDAPVALEGYCPVSVTAMHRWVKGSPSIRSTFDGHTYYFADQRGKQMFDKAPEQFIPALGGDCAVSYAKMGKRVAGNIRFAALHQGRLFLFANAQGKQMFLADPNAYADADLAYGGNCVVCRLNMGQTTAGKADLAVVHKGLRYRFPTETQRAEFLAHPEKYEVAAPTTRGRASGSGNRAGSGSR